MNRTEIHNKIHFFLLVAIAATLPFPLKLNSALIALCALNWLIEGNIIYKIKRSFSNPLNVYWIVFFALHIISYFISTNQHEAGAIIERRLSMLAFPLLIFGSVTKKQTQNILFSFVIGVISALLFCFAKAFQHYLIQHQSNVFFYHNLTSPIYINAVYMAAYTVFAIHVLIDRFTTQEKSLKIFVYTSLAFLVVCCAMLSSKMMLFVLLIGILVKLFLSDRFKHKIHAIIIAGVFLMGIISTIFFIPQLRNRFVVEFTSDFSVLQNQHYTYNTPFTGSSLRLRIWKFCIEILNEHEAWLQGVGIGNFQDLLNEKYTSSGMYTGNSQLHDTGYIGYGPHNEYMEVLLSLGLVALLFFLFILIKHWIWAIKSNHYLLIQLLLMCSLFFTTESMLSTNKGIVFLLFFLSLLRVEQNALSKI